MRLLPRRRRPRIVLAVAGTIAIVVGLVLTAYLTPLMSVRSTDIRDNRAVSGAQVLDAAAVAPGTPLLQVDTRAVAQRVAAIPSVESARVQRSYPSTLTITVTERRPVAVVKDGDQVHVLDRGGVRYLTFSSKEGADNPVPPEMAKLPVLDTPNPGASDPTTRAALTAAAGLPEPLATQVTRVAATSPVDIEFTLTGERTVVWGDSERGAEKARTLGYLLTRKASNYNVSSPGFPSYR